MLATMKAHAWSRADVHSILSATILFIFPILHHYVQKLPLVLHVECDQDLLSMLSEDKILKSQTMETAAQEGTCVRSTTPSAALHYPADLAWRPRTAGWRCSSRYTCTFSESDQQRGPWTSGRHLRLPKLGPNNITGLIRSTLGLRADRRLFIADHLHALLYMPSTSVCYGRYLSDC